MGSCRVGHIANWQHLVEMANIQFWWPLVGYIFTTCGSVVAAENNGSTLSPNYNIQVLPMARRLHTGNEDCISSDQVKC